MKKIVLASNNKGKVKEVKEILKDYEIVTLNDIGFYDDIIEDGETFLDNALIKARAIKKFLGEISVFESRSWNWSSPDKQKHGLFFVVLSILPHRHLTAGKPILFLNGRCRLQKRNQVF